MNPKTEQVLALKNDGWSLRNIANEVGISVFTVRSILNNRPQSMPVFADSAINSYPSDAIPKNEVKALLSGILTEQLQSDKKQFVNRLNRLVKELLDNSNHCTWSREDLQDYTKSVSRLKMDVIHFCEKLEMSFQDLAVYHNTSEIKRYFLDCLKEEAEVLFEFEESFRELVESLKIDSFDELHTDSSLLAAEEVDEDYF